MIDPQPADYAARGLVSVPTRPPERRCPSRQQRRRRWPCSRSPLANAATEGQVRDEIAGAVVTAIAEVVAPEPTADDRRILQLIENMQRQDLDLRDRARAIAELHATGMAQREIADKLGMSPATTSKLSTIGDLLAQLPGEQDRFVTDVLGQKELYGVVNGKRDAMDALRSYLRQVRDTAPERMTGYDEQNDPLELGPPRADPPRPTGAKHRKALTRRERLRKKLRKYELEQVIEIVVSRLDDDAIAHLLAELKAIERTGI